MGEKKGAKARPYPPDFCSASTLAYRLDCSESTLDHYVQAKILPHPVSIGNLKRWCWNDVEQWLMKATESNYRLQIGSNAGSQAEPVDEYSRGLNGARTKETRNANAA